MTTNQDINIDEETTESQFIMDLIKREAEAEKLETEINTYEKQINRLKNSNSLKRTGKWRSVISDKKERVAYIKELEHQVAALETELFLLREKLNHQQAKNKNIDYQSIWRMAKEKKDDGTIVEKLENMIAAKAIRDYNHHQFLLAAARLFMNGNPIYKKAVYEKILSGLKQEEIPEFMVRAGLSEEEIPLKQAASFRGSLTARMRKLQLTGSLPEMILDDKKLAYQFMNMLQVRVPKIDEKVYKLDEIEERDQIVIKPVDGAGARGVYLIYNNDDIIDVREGKKLPNFTVLRRNMERDLEAGRIDENAWIIEEFIIEDKAARTPARDIKFYTFYGKVGIILEIVRYPEVKYCWWTADGKRVSTGKYDYSSFQGKGASPEEIKMAEEISKEIPAPFVRIDFLRGEAGLVFGEFTPKPGNYDEFDTQTDKWLGDFFLEAEAQLENDLLNGKEFNIYKQLLEISN